MNFTGQTGLAPSIFEVANEPASGADTVYDGYFKDYNSTAGTGSDQLLTSPLTASGTTYPAGSKIGTDFAYEVAFVEGGVTKYAWIYLGQHHQCQRRQRYTGRRGRQ